MATRLVHLVVDAADPPGLARFWSAALGWEVGTEEPSEVVVWPRGYDYPDPAALPLVFEVLHPAPERVPWENAWNRLAVSFRIPAGTYTPPKKS